MLGWIAMNTNIGLSLLSVAALALMVVACTTTKDDAGFSGKKAFGSTTQGEQVSLYTLKNAKGMEATIMTYGGILVSLRVPDRNGKLDDVVLGYDSLKGYLSDKAYFGALIGRYGNRIGKGTFSLNGVRYTLATNNGPNHLHGGIKGFDKVIWTVDEKQSTEWKSLLLTYVSKDGEEGYPGTLTVKVRYSVTDANELKIEYEASTDKPTAVNLTHHSYFNLAGAGKGDILGHMLMLQADGFTPVDDGLIPTGEIRPVRGTPMDFTVPALIGARVNADDLQLKVAGGYDHNWVLNRSGAALELAARVQEPTTGRVMEVLTIEPGIQFYCGNFLDGSALGKGGVPYNHRYGFCLETQHFPDSPNHPTFPTTTLNPGEKYSTTTVYRFSTAQ